MNYKTIGLLAHVDAGKTSFAEQLLFHTNRITKRGRVDHKDSFLDSHEIEKARGITVFADQAQMTYKDSHYFLIDTPGHVDFSAEMERAIQVMDYAVLILSAVEGVEGHTETVWNLLRKYDVPTFFFINKIDRIGANVDKVVTEIESNLTNNICIVTDHFKNGVMNEVLLEFLAEQDDTLFDLYLSNKFDDPMWLEVMKQLIRDNKIYPIAYGSALQDTGITTFLDLLDILTMGDYNSQSKFSGKVYKVRYDDNRTKITFIKALSGTLRVREEITYGNKNLKSIGKVTQIRKYNSHKYEIVNEVVAGELFAVAGLTNSTIGDGVGNIQEQTRFQLVPTLKSKVTYSHSFNAKEILEVFKILDEEDPSLNVTWDERLQEIHVHVMGSIQLEVLTHVLKERFNISVTFEKPEILYKETIKSTVNGYGHFEPLKHYAEVHLKLEPAKNGLSFINACHSDDLSKGNQNLVKHYLFEKEHRGILTGSPLTDLKITLLTGRAHLKHTSGGDFKEASLRALRQGLEQAENILLEPFYDVKIKVTTELMGRVLSDIQAAHGQFQTPETNGENTWITAKVPVATFMDYSMTLASFTQGKGTISLRFGGYYPCHNAEEVIQRIGYNKNADPEYSSSSIFCAKGQSYSVPWDIAESKMHCLI